MFAAAAAAKQQVRGHNLCWHTQNPTWLNNLAGNRSGLIAALDSHIRTVVSHYGERAYAWDVVNEAVSDGIAGQPLVKPDFKPWQPALPDFIDRAFIAAREAAGPHVKLFYNDYGAEGINPKSDRVLALVKGLQQRKVPIDGVGFQFHINNQYLKNLESIEANLKRFAALGLDVHITELDVRACSDSTPCDEAALQQQAEVYAGLLKICLGIKRCKVFETWGFTDKHTWITHFNNPTGKDEKPLPFDMSYKPKPAFHAMAEVLQNFTGPRH